MEDLLFRTIFPQDYAFQSSPTPYSKRPDSLGRSTKYSPCQSLTKLSYENHISSWRKITPYWYLRVFSLKINWLTFIVNQIDLGRRSFWTFPTWNRRNHNNFSNGSTQKKILLGWDHTSVLCFRLVEQSKSVVEVFCLSIESQYEGDVCVIAVIFLSQHKWMPWYLDRS